MSIDLEQLVYTQKQSFNLARLFQSRRNITVGQHKALWGNLKITEKLFSGKKIFSSYYIPNILPFLCQQNKYIFLKNFQ